MTHPIMTKEIFDQLLTALDENDFQVGNGYLKHEEVRADAHMGIVGIEEPFVISFRYQPVDVGDEFISVTDYLEKIATEMREAIKKELMFCYLCDEFDEPNELAQYYPQMMKELLTCNE